MKEMKLVYVAIIFWVSEASSPDQGSTQSTFEMKPKTSSSLSSIYVVRYSSFKLGSDANLTCGDKTWTNMHYIIWNLQLKNKNCNISFDFNSVDQNQNSCYGGKSLLRTSGAQMVLNIPNFSLNDVGVYNCEAVDGKGVDHYKINVSITAPPILSSWLDWEGNKRVAVCKAEGGIPAANISWSHTGNISVETRNSSDGFIIVESRLELPINMQTENVSCVISHPYWEHDKSLVINMEKVRHLFAWVHLAIPVSIAIFLGFLCFGQKKLVKLRRGQESTTQSTKSSPTDDVEEVEPYASYVQRVNSIYNSPLDVFK